MILVTGATGTVGRQLVAQLLASGESVRVLVRDPASPDLPAAAERARGDLSDPAGLSAPLDGVDAAFLVWPFTSPEAAAEIAPGVVRAIAEKVPRIVYLSAEAVEHKADGGFWGAIERLVRQYAREWTLLRPTGFAKNTLIWADQIKAGDVVRWPFADAARSLIHEADIARVAVRALTSDGHTGAAYVLSGPESLTQAEQVRTIGAAIGRPLRFEEIPREQARPELVAAFGDEAFADSALDTWASFVTEPEVVTSTVADVTGAPAATLLSWARD
ncbi:MAG TPA: NAD(P)H-binding protein, partial [Micromonosporaceae bacterium]